MKKDALKVTKVTDVTDALARTQDVARQSVDIVYASYASFPWEDAAVYGNWLAQTHYYVRHATRLLAFAAARCPLDREELHRSFLKGVREEAGHEELAMNDLKHLGFTLNDFPELPETTAYYQTLYYAVEHDGPAALIGYFLPLEGLAALKLPADVPTIIKAHSAKGASFLKVHCHLDISHFDEGLEGLTTLTPAELATVRKTLVTSAQQYVRIVSSLKSSLAAGTKPTRRSA